MDEKGLPAVNELKGMTIHQLRVWLKKLGGTPSNKPSAVLVEEITGILNGKQPVKKSNRGRKPKYVLQESVVNVNEIKSGYARFKTCDKLPAEFLSGRKAPLSAHGITAPFSVSVASDDKAVRRPVIADGVLVAEFEQPYIVNYDEHSRYPVFYLKNGIVEFYKLKTGDYITGHAVETAGKYITTEVEKINGVSRDEWKRGANFEDIPSVYPCERFTLSSAVCCRAVDLFSPIGKGSRVLIKESARTNTDALLSAVCSAVQNQAHMVFMPVCAMPEDIGEYAEKLNKAEVVASDFGTDGDEALSRFYVYYERAKRLFEQGEDVVMVINSLQKLYPLIVNAYNEDKTANAMAEVKRILACAKNSAENGSFTLIAVMDESECPELCGEMEELFNCRIELTADAKYRSLGGVDVCKSFSKRMDKTCDETRCEAVEKLRDLIIEKDEPAILAEIFKIASDNDEIALNADNFIKALKA